MTELSPKAVLWGAAMEMAYAHNFAVNHWGDPNEPDAEYKEVQAQKKLFEAAIAYAESEGWRNESQTS